MQTWASSNNLIIYKQVIQQDPTMEHSTQERWNGRKANLEELLKLKAYYIHKREKEKLRLQTKMWSIKCF